MSDIPAFFTRTPVMPSVWVSCQFALVGSVMGCCLFVRPVDCRAQNYGQVNQAAGLEIVESTGTLQVMVGANMQVSTEDGNTLLLTMNPMQTRFEYTNTSSPEILRPGAMIRFVAPFDDKFVSVAPIEEIELFTPVNARRMTREERQAQTPGIYPAPADEDDEADAAAAGQAGQANARAARAEPANRAEPRDRRGPQKANDRRGATNRRGAASGTGQTIPGVADAPEPQRLLVVGRIAGIKDRRLNISTGNQTLLVELSEEAVVTISATETSMCKVGDEVEFVGLRYPAQPNAISAEYVHVTGKEPIAATEDTVSPARRGDNAAGRADPRDKNKRAPRGGGS